MRQYTIRNVPDPVDDVLRQRAKESGKSFNRVVLEALMASTGQAYRFRVGDGIVGTLGDEEASFREEAIRLQRQIDLDLWK